MNLRDKLMKLSEKLHGEIHFLLGIVIAFVVYACFHDNLFDLLVISTIGSFFPDIDHLIYLFFYGKNTDYSIQARGILLSKGFVKYIEYCKENHKNNTGILSHNILTPVISLVLAMYLGFVGNSLLTALFFSITFHFVYDMLEDLLFFGRLNNNWWLRFSFQEK